MLYAFGSALNGPTIALVALFVLGTLLYSLYMGWYDHNHCMWCSKRIPFNDDPALQGECWECECKHNGYTNDYYEEV